VIAGADDFMAFLSQTLADVVTVHHCHTPEIDLTSATTASGIWAMEDMLRWPNDMELHGYGHYLEDYGKVDGQWRITRLVLTRLRRDFIQPDTPKETT
jgi:hypothetical protein